MGRRRDISFELHGPQDSAEDFDSEAKVKSRAEKYGLALDERQLEKPKPGLVRDNLRRERALRKASIIGVAEYDMYTEEEQTKQSARAARFGLQASEPATIPNAKVSEAETAKKARAKKFGLEYKTPSPSDLDNGILYETRTDACALSDPRPAVLHVYGVDLLGTKELLAFFERYGPLHVEWINDSSCNIVFNDEFTVKRLLVQMCEALLESDVAATDGISPSDDSVQHIWYRCKTACTKEGVSVPLLLRVAVKSDVKNWLAPHKTRKLWTMPAHKAVAVAQGKEVTGEAAPNGKGKKKRPFQEEPVAKKKRKANFDEDGDVVMDGPNGKRGGRKARAKQHRLHGMDTGSDDAAVTVAASSSDPVRKGRGFGQTFLHDEHRVDGAHSFFLNECPEEDERKFMLDGHQQQLEGDSKPDVAQLEANVVVVKQEVIDVEMKLEES